MLVKTYSSSVIGIDATTITIEVNLGQGINFYQNQQLLNRMPTYNAASASAPSVIGGGF
jgi:hypothetical protein